MEQLSRKEAISAGKHVCVVATAAVGKENPVSMVHSKILLIFIVERATGIIVDFDVNTACNLTKEFIRSIFGGRNLITEAEEIKKVIQQNYLGASSRALIVAMRSARDRLMDHCEKEQRAQG